MTENKNSKQSISRRANRIEITHVNFHKEQIGPHKLPTTLDIPSFPESQQPRLNNGSASSGLQVGKKNLRVSHQER